MNTDKPHLTSPNLPINREEEEEEEEVELAPPLPVVNELPNSALRDHVSPFLPLVTLVNCSPPGRLCGAREGATRAHDSACDLMLEEAKLIKRGSMSFRSTGSIRLKSNE